MLSLNNIILHKYIRLYIFIYPTSKRWHVHMHPYICIPSSPSLLALAFVFIYIYIIYTIYSISII